MLDSNLNTVRSNAEELVSKKTSKISHDLKTILDIQEESSIERRDDSTPENERKQN